MTTYTYYTAEGRITTRYTGASPETTDADYPTWQRVEGNFTPDRYYILDGAPTLRPTSPVVITGLMLSAVPPGSTLYIDGSAYPVEGDVVELEFPLPGSYSVRVECFPYLDFYTTVTV